MGPNTVTKSILTRTTYTNSLSNKWKTLLGNMVKSLKSKFLTTQWGTSFLLVAFWLLLSNITCFWLVTKARVKGLCLKWLVFLLNWRSGHSSLISSVVLSKLKKNSKNCLQKFSASSMDSLWTSDFNSLELIISLRTFVYVCNILIYPTSSVRMS